MFEPIPLPNSDGQQTTRKVVNVTLIHPNPRNKNAPFKIDIAHQRIGHGKKWENCNSFNLTSLKAGEEIRMILDSEQTLALENIINGLRTWYKEQYNPREDIPTFQLNRVDEVIKIAPDRKKLINELIDKNYSIEIWEQLISSKPDLATKLSLSRIYESRKAIVEEMESKIKESENEEYWQQLLSKNRWIFGNSYIGIIGERRTNISSTLDHPLITEDGYLEIVEIKKPSFPFWKKTSSGEYFLYRGKYLVPHGELQCAITQGSNYIHETEREMDKRSWANSHDGIYPLKPKCLIVHGRSNNWGDPESQSYRLLNDRLHGISIVTFDHMLLRAQQTLELFNPNK